MQDWIKKALIALIVLIVVPVLLNWVLRWDVKLDVITDNNGNGPATWLIFWGSYLAAICSGVMAYVAYNQNNKIREDNAARVQYEEYKAHYELLSKFVYKSVELFDLRRFSYIYYRAEQQDRMAYYDSKRILEEYTSQLEMLSFDALDVVGGVASDEYKQYRSVLKDQNDMFLSFSGKMTETFLNCKGKPLIILLFNLDKDIKSFNSAYHYQMNGKQHFSNESFDFLSIERNRLLQFYGKTQQIRNF